MARSTTTRARAGKTAQAGKTTAGKTQSGKTSAGKTTAGKTGRAQDAIAGFIRTLERLDAAATRGAGGPTQNKAATGAPEAKCRTPEGQ